MWHELDDLENAGSGRPPDRSRDVAAWRRSERTRQIAARRAIPAADRTALSAKIAASLTRSLGSLEGRRISLYWPIRGEPDLRPLIPDIVRLGGLCALPVVVEQGQPLAFRSWQPGERLERGVWNIPVPASGREIEPDIVVAPLVAYDRDGFRLGYGGGYFDRTLAGLSGRPHVIGVGFAAAEIATIYPQPHDIAMDAIVTENGLFEP
jgi:5,10-methenyltetrahydrofolate synthetase